MKKIFIRSTPPSSDIPPGSAGPRIREQFVGMRLTPASGDFIKANPPDPALAAEFRDGDYFVLRPDVIDAFEKAGNAGAADFWRKGCMSRYLLFPKEICKVVK